MSPINPHKIFKVAAFTHNQEGGSPTGVVLNANALSEEQMRLIANGLNVSHTAFVFEPAGDFENVRVRFLTPDGEILNCGHGTIAAHYTRAKFFNLDTSRVLFQEAKEGTQRIEFVVEKEGLEVFLKQNPIQFSEVEADIIHDLLNALGISESDLAKDFPVAIASPGSNRFLVGVSSLNTLNNIRPDFNKLKSICATIKGIGCFVYAVTNLNPAEATARMLAPNIGVNEDIINGNSSGCLAAYMLKMSGKNNLILDVKQGHMFGCEGLVKVKVKRRGANFEAVIGGTARILEEIKRLVF